MGDAFKGAAAGAGNGAVCHVANETSWRAVCTKPDFCKVGKDIVGFDSFAILNTKATASLNVKAQGVPVYRLGDLIKNIQADAGSHILAGTSLGTGYVKILDGQDNVKVNGIAVARHDSRCLINCDAAGNGGAPGKLVTEKKNVASALAAKPMLDRMQDESGQVLKARWKSLKDSAKTVWDAMPGTSDAATAAAARQKIGDGFVGTVEALGTLAGPPPEAIQGAYMSGNPEAIALIEGMQARQQQAVGAVIDHVKQSVTDANARNGAAGASAMILTTLGVEVLGGKGLGAIGKVAGRISDIVRLAKSPLEAAMALEKEITAAKLAGRSVEEIKLLEKARDERLALVRKEAAKPDESNGGVHVKKGNLPPSAESELNRSRYTTRANSANKVGSAADNIYSGTRPMVNEFPELNGVNPHYVENAGLGVNTNCVSCVNATHQRLMGQASNAVADATKYSNQNGLLSSAPFGFGPTTTPASIIDEMLATGHGSTGPLIIQQPGNVQHVINVVNRNGQVYFIDSQIGKIVELHPTVPVKLGRQ